MHLVHFAIWYTHLFICCLLKKYALLSNGVQLQRFIFLSRQMTLLRHILKITFSFLNRPSLLVWKWGQKHINTTWQKIIMASNERRKVAGAAADFFLLLQYYYTVRRSGKRNASCPTKGVFPIFLHNNLLIENWCLNQNMDHSFIEVIWVFFGHFSF